VRRGQGSSEFSANVRPGQKTPDIVAGTVLGSEKPSDFYIDVQSPSGDYLVKAELKAVRARELYDTARRTGVFKFPELDTDYFQRVLIAPLEKKIEKYARSRQSSLYGHILYFAVLDGPDHLGVAALDHLSVAGAIVAERHGDQAGIEVMIRAEEGGITARDIQRPAAADQRPEDRSSSS
jgi:hypothetical protein